MKKFENQVVLLGFTQYFIDNHKKLKENFKNNLLAL